MTRRKGAVSACGSLLRPIILSVWWCAMFHLSASAQQVTNTVPLQNTSDGFYETFGIHWGFRLTGPNGGVFFDNGGFGGVAPPFGGFDPNSAARFGFARGGTNGGFFLDFMAAQGSNRSMVTQAPLLTLPHGGAGAVYNSSQTPFVTGWVPVVGSSPLEERLSRMRQGDTGGVREPAGGPAASTLPPRSAPPGVPPAAPRKMAVRGMGDEEQDLPADSDKTAVSGGGGGGVGLAAGSSESSAARGDLSVAEIRRQQAAASASRDAEVDGLLEQARAAESQGKAGVARIFYQQAARRATGDRQRELTAKIRELTR